MAAEVNGKIHHSGGIIHGNGAAARAGRVCHLCGHVYPNPRPSRKARDAHNHKFHKDLPMSSAPESEDDPNDSRCSSFRHTREPTPDFVSIGSESRQTEDELEEKRDDPISEEKQGDAVVNPEAQLNESPMGNQEKPEAPKMDSYLEEEVEKPQNGHVLGVANGIASKDETLGNVPSLLLVPPSEVPRPTTKSSNGTENHNVLEKIKHWESYNPNVNNPQLPSPIKEIIDMKENVHCSSAWKIGANVLEVHQNNHDEIVSMDLKESNSQSNGITKNELDNVPISTDDDEQCGDGYSANGYVETWHDNHESSVHSAVPPENSSPEMPILDSTPQKPSGDDNLSSFMEPSSDAKLAKVDDIGNEVQNGVPVAFGTEEQKGALVVPENDDHDQLGEVINAVPGKKLSSYTEPSSDAKLGGVDDIGNEEQKGVPVDIGNEEQKGVPVDIGTEDLVVTDNDDPDQLGEVVNVVPGKQPDVGINGVNHDKCCKPSIDEKGPTANDSPSICRTKNGSDVSTISTELSLHGEPQIPQVNGSSQGRRLDPGKSRSLRILLSESDGPEPNSNIKHKRALTLPFRRRTSTEGLSMPRRRHGRTYSDDPDWDSPAKMPITGPPRWRPRWLPLFCCGTY